jgi:transposase InsO family protein
VPSSDRNTVVLSIIDRATGFIWAYPCKDATAQTVAEVLYRDHFLDWQFPVNLISDNGPAFTSALLAELDRLSGVKHIFTTPYNPSSNGRVERIHRTFKAALKIYVNHAHTDWDRQLKAIVYAIRTTPLDGSVYSPYQLYHNRAPVTPLNLLSGQWDKKTDPTDPLDTAFEVQLKAAKIMMELAEKRSQDLENLRSKFKDVPPVWNSGQMVLVRRPNFKKDLSRKFLYEWAGPYVIKKRVTPVNYTVDLGNGKSQTYHVNILHPYNVTSHPGTVGLQQI